MIDYLFQKQESGDCGPAFANNLSTGVTKKKACFQLIPLNELQLAFLASKHVP